MLQKPNISKPKKITKRNLTSKTPPEVSKLLNTIGLDSSSSFINSRSSSSSENKVVFVVKVAILVAKVVIRLSVAARM